MRLLATIIRVLFGFAIACLVAGVATVAFVVTPGDVAALPADVRPELLGNAGVLSLLAATHSAIFAFPFALIAIAFGEWLRIRSWIFYSVVGILIAMGGFFAVSYFEVAGQPTIVNNYAIRAFFTAGFFGGLAYWLVAGRGAGGRHGDHSADAGKAADAEKAATAAGEDADAGATEAKRDEPSADDKLAGAAT
jgi:hypothetical protein